MSKNTGTEYELLTKEVYEGIIKKEGLEILKVLSVLKGRKIEKPPP